MASAVDRLTFFLGSLAKAHHVIYLDAKVYFGYVSALKKCGLVEQVTSNRFKVVLVTRLSTPFMTVVMKDKHVRP